MTTINSKFFFAAVLIQMTDLVCSELVQWIWPELIQQELDELKDRFNNHVSRKNRKKRIRLVSLQMLPLLYRRNMVVKSACSTLTLTL